MRVWVWLLVTGVLSVTTTTAPPATSCCLIGSCVTSGGIITSVDTSGVLYMKGGSLVRYSADPGIATDSPPASVKFRSVTPFASFDWEGAAYRQIYAPSVTADPTSGAEGLAWFRSDAQQQKVWTGGAPVVVGGSAILSAAPVVGLSISPGSTYITWAVPAILTEFNGADINRVQVNLANATQARIIVNAPAAFGPVGSVPVLVAMYSTNGGSTWSYLDGSAGPSVSYAVGTAIGSWVTLASGAKADVLIAVFAAGGSPTTCHFGTLQVQFR
jgi:hypothetical protein